jgi:exodeoxyribonuclease VIII
MAKIEYVKDTFQEYLNNKTHISASDIKNFLISPAYYFYKKFLEPKSDEEHKHFIIGTALHELILEPEMFKSNYIISPKYDLRTKEGKKDALEFKEKNFDKVLLNADDYEMIVNMATVAGENKTFVELLKDSYRELSCYTIDDKTKLDLRLRPDCFSLNKCTIVDIKTCQSSSYKSFKSDIYKFQYSISSAFYCDFLGRENYVFCAIEKTKPYQTALYMISDDMLQYGREQYRLALDLMRWCIDNFYYPSYNEFEILKECYDLNNLDSFFDLCQKSEKITIIR